MNYRILFLGFAFLVTAKAHAQTATDIDTQIKTTHDIVEQMTRTLKMGIEDSNLNLSDYRKWKVGFDQRVEQAMIHFENEINGSVLPMIAEASKPYLRVWSSKALNADDRTQLMQDEWIRLNASPEVRTLYRNAVIGVYTEIFADMPMYYTSQAKGDDDFMGGYDKLRFMNASGKVVETVTSGGIRRRLCREFGHCDYNGDQSLYIFLTNIYPGIRKQCETRGCITLMTRKLDEAYRLTRKLLDIDRSILIGGNTLTLSKVLDKLDYYDSTFFTPVLKNSNLYPAEVKSLPLDTNN